jgi:phosphatidylserine decarboxylase
VDIFLPLGTKINVELNQVVKGGRTVLAELLNNVALPSETSDVVETHIPDVEKPLSDEHGEPTLVIEHDLEKEQADEKPETKATPAKKPTAAAKTNCPQNQLLQQNRKRLRKAKKNNLSQIQKAPM